MSTREYSHNLRGTSKDLREQLHVLQQELAFKTGKVKPRQYAEPLVNWKLEDAHFLIEFENKDTPVIENLFSSIRRLQTRYKLLHKFSKMMHTKRLDAKMAQAESAKNKLLHEYFDCLIDHVNDHKDAFMQVQGRKIIPYKVAYRDDVQTLVGVGIDNKNITGEGFTQWSHVAVGTGIAPAYVWSDSLTTEVLVQDFGHGFFTASGLAILYAALFGELVATNTYQEGLVRNQSTQSGSSVLCKQTFTNDPINHTSGSSGFAVAGILEYAPIVDTLI